VPRDTHQLEATFGQARQRCWEVLTSVDTLASWVGIVHSVEEIEHLVSYRAVLEDRVGPVRLKAPLAVAVEVTEAAVNARIHASGKDRQVNSSITLDVDMTLADLPEGGTRMDMTASYSVTGKVAAMSRGIIQKKADKIIAEFLASSQKELA
jgi:carbon monoxide dehydrogenase subunit G